MGQYFKDLFKGIWTVLIGMKVTLSHVFVPAVTIQYPDVELKLPERARNRLYVNMDDCIGCDQCSMACPVDCITIETVKALPTDDLGLTSTGQKKRLWVTKFDIDIAKCCYCGLCVSPCPTECIKMTDVYEFAEFDRHNLIYNFATLTPAEVAEVKRKAAEYDKEQSAKKAAVASAKAVPPTGGTTPAQAAKAAAPAAPIPAAAPSTAPTSAASPATAQPKPAPSQQPAAAQPTAIVDPKSNSEQTQK